ncbi:LysR family transcriptional regulator [Photobacterium nomapromontoriensis]|uniref:LysR family transcriptional regulator n=1 Tax=Photobacterium nomapromontoriensis TaxID=2910237 RepID=UPI003D09D4CD
MYNLDQLNMFVTAAKLGSFSACARHLGKVQSAVSQGISNLEIDLNVELFDRSTRKPGLTEEGQHLLTFAEAILQQARELESASKALTKHEETQLTLVVDDGLQVDKLFDILDTFGQQFTSTSLHMKTASSSDIIDIILSGEANIGVMLSDFVMSREVDLCYIGNMTFIPVVCSSHPLSLLSKVEPADMIPIRQLSIRGSHLSKQQHFPAISSRVWSTNNPFSLMALVEKGMGWTYLPRHLALNGIESGRLHALPVSFDHKEWSIPVESLTPKGISMGPATVWLKQALNGLLDD